MLKQWRTLAANERPTFQSRMIDAGVKPLKSKDDYYEWRSCKTKHQFASNAEAEKARIKMIESDELKSYECNYCGGFHIGHTEQC